MSGPAAECATTRGLLRILTCGSVDDGKSTLLGRLVLDTGAVPSDLLASLGGRDSIDLSLLFDGLEAEREQGITIDVTHRTLLTPRRRFRLLDAPGHEQYTRNMATAASGADLAVLLVDAERGLLPQTRRHAAICDLFGVRHLVLAVNKMDRVGFDERQFNDIVSDFTAFSSRLGFASIQPIPLSALQGDNVAALSPSAIWWRGPTLLSHLEEVDLASEAVARPLRLPVQLVLREGARRRYAGTVASGRLSAGETVMVAPSGRRVRIEEVSTPTGPVSAAEAGEAVTITLGDDADLARGDVVASTDEPPSMAAGFAADLIWLADGELLPGRSHLVRIGTATVPGAVTSIGYRLDIETLGHAATATLAQNEIGHCHLHLSAPVAFDPFRAVPATGTFVLIDREDFRTVAAGVIRNPLRRATNVHPQAITIGREARAGLKGQKPALLWLTGLSGSGKSTIANLVEERLWMLGRHTMLLDGDNMRHGLNQDLGFSEADRVENIRRVAEVARLMLEAGLIVICSFISPYRAERRLARERAGTNDFLEIFVDAPLEECAKRDPKGLYARARSGEIPLFTGISSPYEPPEAPELRLDTLARPAAELADAIVDALRRRGIIEA